MGFEHEYDLWTNVNGEWVPVSGPFEYDLTEEDDDSLYDDRDSESFSL